MKIDTKKWQKFLLSDLFEIKKGTRLTKADMKDGNINFVGASAFNNGITKHISNNEALNPANVLTVNYNGSVGETFYQDEIFWASDDVNILIPKFKMNKYIALFIAPIIKKVGKSKYAFIDKWKLEDMEKDFILLPTIDNQPDWRYMEDYIKGIENKIIQNISTLKVEDSLKQKINTVKWKDFHLYDDKLFTIYSGNKFDRSKMSTNKPEIYFIGRTAINNGINAIVDIIDNIAPYDAGCITIALGGSIGASFVQTKPFYTSQNVVVLKPNINMSELSKRFICSMIQKESSLHYKAFIKELNKHIKRDFVIKLPILENGEPDFIYMDEFMKIIEYKTKNNLENLKNCT